MGDSTGSEWISPAEFHRAPGVADWRVTGTGPQAVFTATSLFSINEVESRSLISPYR